MGEWYYIGHYGQLGPLTLDQIQELVQGGVIVRDTYVWRTGMPTWIPAATIPELGSSFALAEPFAAPPPPPMSAQQTINRPPQQPGPQAPFGQMFSSPNLPMQYGNHYHFQAPMSDRSRILAGILNICLPFGVGRFYLGYMAIGVMQLLFSFCGIGALWSIIDGIAMLCGATKFDGYGRSLRD